MSLGRQIMGGLRVLIKRRVSDRDLADEAQHYLEQATEEYIARGFSPEEARRAARLEFSVSRHSESSHPARSSR